jgi:hypothetical protein
MGTTTQNIKLMNTSPSGDKAVAPGHKYPTTQPATIPVSIQIKKPYVFQNAFIFRLLSQIPLQGASFQYMPRRRQMCGKERPPLLKATAAFRKRGLERREIKKRLYKKDAALDFRSFYVYRILVVFERQIAKLKTKIDDFMNIFAKRKVPAINFAWD